MLRDETVLTGIFWGLFSPIYQRPAAANSTHSGSAASPKQNAQKYFPTQFSPGPVDCRQPYGARALETSHYRSYITRLTAAILPCFHFNHERSCSRRTARGSARLTRWRLGDGRQGQPDPPPRCLMHLLDGQHRSAEQTTAALRRSSVVELQMFSGHLFLSTPYFINNGTLFRCNSYLNQ